MSAHLNHTIARLTLVIELCDGGVVLSAVYRAVFFDLCQYSNKLSYIIQFIYVIGMFLTVRVIAFCGLNKQNIKKTESFTYYIYR